jgi:hypothetical protein
MTGSYQQAGRCLACVLAATVLTWWLSMKAIEYFLQGG